MTGLHVLRAADGRPLLQTRDRERAWAIHRTQPWSRLYLDGALLSTMLNGHSRDAGIVAYYEESRAVSIDARPERWESMRGRGAARLDPKYARDAVDDEPVMFDEAMEA